MAEEENESIDETLDAPPKRGNRRLVLIAFISTVCLVESGLFFFLVPSAEEVAALAEAQLVADLKEAEENERKKEEEQNSILEFSLGRFGVNYASRGDSSRMRVEFDLFGEIKAADEEAVTKDYEAKNGRIRHEVLMKVRTSELEDLKDPELTLLRRRILATCNEILDKRYILSVKFRDFQTIEE